MRQKTQLACALIRPVALLCSTSRSSASTRRPRGCCTAPARGQGRRARRVLLTTHQMGFADGLADRAVMLDEGEVADEGRGRRCAGGPRAGWLL